MSDVTDAPKAGVKGLKAALEKIPKWGWVAGGGGLIGYVYYKRKKNAEAAAAAATAASSNTTSTNATPTADQGSTSQAVDQDPNAFADYGGGGYSGGGGGGYSDPGVSSGSTDTTGSTELADFGTLLSTLSASGLTGPATSQNALSTTSAGTTPAANVAPPAQGVVVSNQPATATAGNAAQAPAPKTNVQVGNPRQGLTYSTGTYKGKAAHIYSGAVPGGVGPKKNTIIL